VIQQSDARVAIILVELQLPQAQSLKDKRQVISSLKRKIANGYNCSVAETGMVDKWQRAQLGFALIANETSRLDTQAQSILELIESTPEVIVLERGVEIIDASG
jgi:uncharacterized protein YlxP (DUF503 family)